MVPPARACEHQIFGVLFFMPKQKIFLGLIIILSLLATVFGFTKNFSGIAWPLVSIGVFIWGDAIILGPFFFFSAIVLWKKNNPALTGLWFSLYASTRAFIEILYNLNAQFSTTTRPWEMEIKEYALNSGRDINEIFVLGQLLFTVIFIISIFLFIKFLNKYLKPGI